VSDLIGLLVDLLIGLGWSTHDTYLGGPKFNVTYVSGHPEFTAPDEKGRLVLARDRLRYATGSTDSVRFEIPFGLIAGARALDPDMVELHLAAEDGSSSDMYFRSRKPQEIKQFLKALGGRVPTVAPVD
jgi:hypothetical protein